MGRYAPSAGDRDPQASAMVMKGREHRGEARAARTQEAAGEGSDALRAESKSTRDPWKRNEFGDLICPSCDLICYGDDDPCPGCGSYPALWPAGLGNFYDIDGDGRPNPGDTADIGCDEVP